MIPSPHDALFKAVLGQPEHARGMLRAVVPVALAEALDWSALSLCPGSFVDSTLSHRHADLLYSTAWHRGGAGLIYFLFEHQSAPPTDGLMAHRLLRYQVRIWDRWRTDHPKTRTLPMLIPVVMYHGATPWPEARSFDDLLDVPADIRPAVEPHLVRFTYVLNDLSELADDELREGAMRTALARLVAMCFKHAPTRADFLQILGRWIDIVREVARAPNGLEALALVMRYILEVNEHVGPEALQALFEQDLGPEAKDAIMTAGQQLIEQGIEQGRQQERQQNRQRFQEVLLRLLRQRFGNAVDHQVEQRIAAASVEQVEIWYERVLSAATLTELFGD